MSDLDSFADAAIRSIEEPLTEESLLVLQSIFPRSLILAALDLLDRKNVFKCTTPSQTFYQVLGSNALYNVFLDLGGPLSTYCTCPAYSHLVLSSETYIMCKHILAVRIGTQVGRCLDRLLSTTELSDILTEEYSV